MDMLDRPRARSGALNLVHFAPAPEPGKKFHYRHEPAFRCGERNNPKRCNQPAQPADGSTGSRFRQPFRHRIWLSCGPMAPGELTGMPRQAIGIPPARGFPHMRSKSETLRLEGVLSENLDRGPVRVAATATP
jgi:hypothetical protein